MQPLTEFRQFFLSIFSELQHCRVLGFMQRMPLSFLYILPCQPRFFVGYSTSWWLLQWMPWRAAHFRITTKFFFPAISSILYSSWKWYQRGLSYAQLIPKSWTDQHSLRAMHSINTNSIHTTRLGSWRRSPLIPVTTTILAKLGPHHPRGGGRGSTAPRSPRVAQRVPVTSDALFTYLWLLPRMQLGVRAICSGASAR